MDAQVVYTYFPDLTGTQKRQFEELFSIYDRWNEQINVISRKDIDQLYIRHVLHSLAIGKFVQFLPGSQVLDIGTGGGFPGIPLAILFPQSNFHLVDSIGKKIKVVNEVVKAINLKNVTTAHQRAESVTGSFDFIVSRAVAKTNLLYQWTASVVSPKSIHSIPNGFLFLKGGDLSEELSSFNRSYKEIELSDFFKEEFFETKKLIYIPK